MCGTANSLMKFVFLVMAVYKVHTLDYKDVIKMKRTFANTFMECDLETKDETIVKAEHIFLHAFSTRTNKSHVWNLLEAGSALTHNPDFDPNDKTYVFIPGVLEGTDYADWDLLKPYFLKVKNINFFYIDCTQYTTGRGFDPIEGILEVSQNVYGVGVRIGDFCNKLVSDAGYPLKRIHVFCHSLGSVISARVGKVFKSLSGKKLARITALDPAGLCFSQVGEEYQLTEEDATYVDMYHSNAGYWGSDKFYGDVHILLNGGGPVQDQCPPILLASTLCAHQNMVLTFWAKSALNPDKYSAVKCDTLEDGKKGKCFGEKTPVGADYAPGPGFYYLPFSFDFAPQLVPTVTDFFRKLLEGVFSNDLQTL